MTEKNPTEWVEGQKVGRAARQHVSKQLRQLIEDADLTGSRELVADRIKSYAAAVKANDSVAERAALMEIAAAAAATAAGIDVHQRRGLASAA